MKVDPAALTSDVTGTMHTMVGREEVSAAPKIFHYGWAYNGVSLKLVQFGMVVKDPSKSRFGGEAS
jgi:conjugal transfer pilus assembly protein TraE